MITWVTVWVLTVSYNGQKEASYYQLQYATQKTCLNQIKKHEEPHYKKARCDFQQIPVVTK